MSNLRYKLEALLFASARSMSIEELSSLTKASPEEIRETLNGLKQDYEKRDSSITLIDEGNSFRLNIKSEHANVVRQIVTETELSKTLMETLAVIAFKYPIKQSDLIKIRTNKAYDHLKELEVMGYITRQKFGRTNLIKLTPKFFDYFDLPPEKLKEKFQGFEGIAKAIKEKEQEIKNIKEDIKKQAREAGKKSHKDDAEIDLIDQKGHKQPLEIYSETEQEKEQQESKEIEQVKEKVGNLEVVDLPEEEPKDEEEKTSEESEEQPQEESEESSDEPASNEEASTEPESKEESGQQPEEPSESVSR